MTSVKHNLQLFTAAFISAFLFIFGAGTLALMFVPVAADLLLPAATYQALLPLTEVRTEPFFKVGREPVRALFPPLPVSAKTNTEEAPVASGSWIRIPAINVNVPLALSPSLDDRDILATLNQGAALYPNGVEPGHLGNTFISAHSTGEPWKGKYRFAFLKINDLAAGNVMHIDHNGTRYTYRITKKEIITPTADFRVASDRPVPTITLMACWPLWSTSQRMLIHGELTHITKLTPQPT